MLPLLLALALPSNLATWYTAHVCRSVDTLACSGWTQVDQARRCDVESPLSCVALTHTSTKLPFVGEFDGEGLVTLTVFAPKGPKKVWER